jgi:hypothetical protein
MSLLVVPATSGLEEASWVVTIAAFALIIIQLFLYWFGRNSPLQVKAHRQLTKNASGELQLFIIELRSRSRDTQTVREVLLVDLPPWYYRLRHHKYFKGFDKKRLRSENLNQPGNPLPLTIDGHDTAELKMSFAGTDLPFGPHTRLKVRASRTRPHFARIRRGGA